MSLPGNSKRTFFCNHQLRTLFVIALILRLLVLVLVADQVDRDQMKVLVPDAKAYYSAADQIREDFRFDNKVILTYGPGYPSFLALLGWIVSPTPIILLILQVFLSAAGSVLLALLAFQLTGDTRIAFVSGLINATSISSISLSAIFLSETLFFVLMVSGLLLYFEGLKSRRLLPFLFAGIVFGSATLVRVMGQYFIVPLLIVAVIYYWPEKGMPARTLFQKLRMPLTTVVIVVLLSGLWIVRNNKIHELPAVSLAQSMGLAKFSTVLVSKIDNISYDSAGAITRNQFHSYRQGESSYARDFSSFARSRVLQLSIEHPWTAISTFSRNCFNNANTQYGIILYILPDWRESVLSVVRWIDKKGLNYRSMVLVAIGALLLIRRRRFAVVSTLLTVHLYFGLTAGFTVTQGYRIFYPAQMTGAILMAYPLLEGYEYIRRKMRRAPENQTGAIRVPQVD